MIEFPRSGDGKIQLSVETLAARAVAFALQAGVCMLLDHWITMVLALWKLSCILIILLLGFRLLPKQTLPIFHTSIADLGRIGLPEMATFTASNCCWKLQLAH